MDLDPFLATPPVPLPERPVALFVGVLERYKAVDVPRRRLAARRAAACPDARLGIVGRGTMTDVVERLVAELPRERRVDAAACRRPTWRGRWTRRPCSCSRPARKGSAAS